MTNMTVIIRKWRNHEFYSAEFVKDGVELGATAISSIEIEELGELLTCYRFMRKINGSSHMMIMLYNIKLDIRCEETVVTLGKDVPETVIEDFTVPDEKEKARLNACHGKVIS